MSDTLSENAPTAHAMKAEVAGLYRYPVKGLSAEPLPIVALFPGQTVPGDRRYAIENGPSGFDPVRPAWKAKTHYMTLMRHERLAGLRSRFDEASGMLAIEQDGSVVVRADLGTAEGRNAVESYFVRCFPSELKGPPKVLTGADHSFSDVARKVVSIINLQSVMDIADMLGRDVNPLRFRANLVCRGWPAWQESTLLNRTLVIGAARLKVVKRITRCAATNVDPVTAARDMNIPDLLMQRFGHNECGIYAEVISPGTIRVGDSIALESPIMI